MSEIKLPISIYTCAFDSELPSNKTTWQRRADKYYLKQGQNVCMLQIATFWDIYLHIYGYIYIYIYTCSALKVVGNIFIEDAMPEKALKYAL